MLVSAASSVLREVAMFMRAWFAPPRPYVLPAFSAIFAFFASQLTVTSSAVIGFPPRPFDDAAASFAPIRLPSSVRSSHIRYVPWAFLLIFTSGTFAAMNFCAKSWLPSMYSTHWFSHSSPPWYAALLAIMPSVVRSARFISLARLTCSGLVEKNHAHFIAASPNDLLAALKVTLLSTTALFGSVAKGVYLLPFVTKSQWISSASTSTRCFRQISPMRIRSSCDQVLPVGFCGLHRMNAFVSMLIR